MCNIENRFYVWSFNYNFSFNEQKYISSFLGLDTLLKLNKIVYVQSAGIKFEL